MDIAALIVQKADEQLKKDRAERIVRLEVTTTGGYGIAIEVMPVSPNGDILVRYKALELRASRAASSGPSLEAVTAVVQSLLADDLACQARRSAGHSSGHVKVRDSQGTGCAHDVLGARTGADHCGALH